MQIAARSGATQVLEQLIGLGFSATKPCDVNGESMLPIHIAAKEGQVSAVAHLAKANPATIRARTTRGLEPLHLACVHGHGSVVSFLIHEAHVPVNAATTDGDAPIFLAAREGSADAIRVLLGHAQCDLTAEPHTPTCLHVAALNGHVEVVESLIDAFLSDPVDVREMMMELDFLPSKRQRRLPSKAAAVNRREWRSLLTARTSEGYTATHLAVISDHVRVVRTLTTFKSRLTPPEIDTLLNGEADNHLTPLQLASYRGNAEMVEALVLQGADVNKRTNCFGSDLSAVEIACAEKHFPVVEYLIATGGATVDVKRCLELSDNAQHPQTHNFIWLSSQWTPLMFACYAKQPCAVRNCLRKGTRSQLFHTDTLSHQSASSLAIDSKYPIWRSRKTSEESTKTAKVMALAAQDWGPANHHLWPDSFRERAKFMFLLSQRLQATSRENATTPHLPNSIWFHLVGVMAKLQP
eukprot:c17742_g1_i2.p1 GENE.c17742_g1_i2~~c17742_g1_i2.p1  ORF type:complete len:467 (+),score=73.00 c17742_g1_i2:1253-2653(+)